MTELDAEIFNTFLAEMTLGDIQKLLPSKIVLGNAVNESPSKN